MSTVSVTNLKHESASGNNITLDSSGNVGVGTSSPGGYKLAIGDGSSNRGRIMLKGATSGNYPEINIDDTANSGKNFQVISSAGSFFVNDQTGGGLTRFKIDTDGRVTMPYQPCCSVYHTADKAWNSGGFSPIVWDAARYNVGNHYNTSTGLFTAPVSGRYLVTTYLHWMGDGAYTFQYLRVQVGGLDAGIELMRQGTKGNHDVWGGSQVLSVSANDSIRVVMGQVGIDAGYSRGTTTFNLFEVYFLG